MIAFVDMNSASAFTRVARRSPPSEAREEATQTLSQLATSSLSALTRGTTLDPGASMMVPNTDTQMVPSISRSLPARASDANNSSMHEQDDMFPALSRTESFAEDPSPQGMTDIDTPLGTASVSSTDIRPRPGVSQSSIPTLAPKNTRSEHDDDMLLPMLSRAQSFAQDPSLQGKTNVEQAVTASVSSTDIHLAPAIFQSLSTPAPDTNNSRREQHGMFPSLSRAPSFAQDTPMKDQTNIDKSAREQIKASVASSVPAFNECGFQIPSPPTRTKRRTAARQGAVVPLSRTRRLFAQSVPMISKENFDKVSSTQSQPCTPPAIQLTNSNSQLTPTIFQIFPTTDVANTPDEDDIFPLLSRTKSAASQLVTNTEPTTSRIIADGSQLDVAQHSGSSNPNSTSTYLPQMFTLTTSQDAQKAQIASASSDVEAMQDTVEDTPHAPSTFLSDHLGQTTELETSEQKSGIPLPSNSSRHMPTTDMSTTDMPTTDVVSKSPQRRVLNRRSKLCHVPRRRSTPYFSRSGKVSSTSFEGHVLHWREVFLEFIEQMQFGMFVIFCVWNFVVCGIKVLYTRWIG